MYMTLSEANAPKLKCPNIFNHAMQKLVKSICVLTIITLP